MVEAKRVGAHAAAGGASGDISPLDPFSRLREKALSTKAPAVMAGLVPAIHARTLRLG